MELLVPARMIDMARHSEMWWCGMSGGKRRRRRGKRACLKANPDAALRHPGYACFTLAVVALEAAALRTGRFCAAVFDMAERNASLGEIVGRQLERHLVARKYADMVFPHFSGSVGNQLVAVVEVDAEAAVRQYFGNTSVHFNQVFFSHASFQYKGIAAAESSVGSKLSVDRPAWLAAGAGKSDPRADVVDFPIVARR
jgi:hypothetical protein